MLELFGKKTPKQCIIGQKRIGFNLMWADDLLESRRDIFYETNGEILENLFIGDDLTLSSDTVVTFCDSLEDSADDSEALRPRSHLPDGTVKSSSSADGNAEEFWDVSTVSESSVALKQSCQRGLMEICIGKHF